MTGLGFFRSKRRPGSHRRSAGGSQLALELFERSGFEAFEPGRSLFDVPVLIYVVQPDGRWPAFSIHDHRGVRFGTVTSETERRRKYIWTTPQDESWIEIWDDGDLPALLVNLSADSGGAICHVGGRANADIAAAMPGFDRLDIVANGESYGQLHGAGSSGIAGPDLTVLDHHQRQVAVMRTGTPDGGPSSEGFVVSVGANLEGELRRLIVALPIVVALFRVVHQRGPDLAIEPRPRRG